jgi:hypothetical protein
LSRDNPYTHYGKPLLGSALAAIAAGGFVVGVGGESFRSSYWTYVVTHVVYLTLVGFLVWLVFDVRTRRFKLPEVRAFIDDNLVLLCEPVEWLGYGAAVGIFRREGEYERPVGGGQVINIQDNGLVQVEIVKPFIAGENSDEFRSTIRNIKTSDFIIKPGQIS